MGAVMGVGTASGWCSSATLACASCAAASTGGGTAAAAAPSSSTTLARSASARLIHPLHARLNPSFRRSSVSLCSTERSCNGHSGAVACEPFVCVRCACVCVCACVRAWRESGVPTYDFGSVDVRRRRFTLLARIVVTDGAFGNFLGSCEAHRVDTFQFKFF